MNRLVAPLVARVRMAVLLLALTVTSTAYCADIDILIVGSTGDSTNSGNVSGTSGAFDPTAVRTYLQNILQGAGVGTVNVVVENRGNPYGLAAWFHYPYPAGVETTTRWPNLRGEAGTDWDYVILIGDPYTMEYMPGLYAHGVAKVAQEVAKGGAETVLLMPWPKAGSNSSVAHYKEVVYRAGRSGPYKVAPAALAWQAAGSPTGATHPSADGAFIAAASIYSTIWNQSASASTYVYNDALANTVHTSVTTNNSAVQYTGNFSFQNPFLMLGDKRRDVHYSEKGTSTEQDFKGSVNAAMDRARVTYSVSPYDDNYNSNTPADDGLGWPTSNPMPIAWNHGRKFSETAKEYVTNPAYWQLGMGFMYQHNTWSNTVADANDIHISNILPYDIYLAGYMRSANNIATGQHSTARSMPWRLIWAQIHQAYPTLNPLRDGSGPHLNVDLHKAVGTYMYTLYSGRCPLDVQPNPITTTWYAQKVGYETAWRLGRCQTRAPGFKVLPSAATKKTIMGGTTETMSVQFILPPQSNVTVNITSSNPSAATVSPSTLTFTPANYSTAQSITVTALSGLPADINFDVVFNTVSTDEAYNNLNDSWRYTAQYNLPTVTWTAASQSSANESGTMTVTAQLSAVSGQAVTVPFTVTGTATSGTDYAITASPLTIPAGALSASATITITGDTVYEGNETVILTMGTVTNATKGTTTVHTATITNDDANPNSPPFIESSPWANPNPVARSETTMLSVMALDDGLPNPPAALTYTWSTVSGPGTVTYGANNGTATGDNCLAGFSAVGTYVIKVVISDSQLTASGQVSVTVVSTPPVANAQSVTTPLGTAKAITLTGSDADGDTLIYAIVTPPAHGTLSGTAPSVTYTPAANYVGGDSFTFSVTDPSGATASAVVSISVTPPSVSASLVDAEASEPNAAANKGTAKFRFTRTGSLAASLAVKYTLSGTATNGTDYTTLSGTATIAANASSVDVTLTALTDALDEANETAIATIAPNAAYVVSTTAPSATVTIYDAEYGPPTVSASASDNAASEPNGAAAKGTGKFRFTRTGSLAASLTVKYTLSGTATNGSDYTTLSGTATIAANATYVDVTLTALTDTLDESDETAIATITPNAAYVVSTTAPSATVTIYDAEYGPPTVSASASDNAASEPNGAAAKGTGKFRFTRTGSLAASLTVKYTLSGTATNGADYTSLSGTATIAANKSYADVVVTALTDALDEAGETAIATIAPDAAYAVSTTAPSATVTIYDAEYGPPTVSASASDATASEPGAAVNSGTGKFRFTRTGSLDASLTVKYTLSGTATNGVDYTSLSGTATIAANRTYVDVTVTALADSLLEPNENAVATIAPDAAYTVSSTAPSATVAIVSAQ